MKHINSYNTPADYAADASNRPSGESFAGMVQQRPEFVGANIIRPWADRSYADAIFFDKFNNERVVIKAGTIDLSKLDQGRYFNCKHAYIGQIYGREFSLGTQLSARQFATGDEWTVSDLDFSAAGSITLRFKYLDAAAGNTKDLEYAWEAGEGSVEAFVAAINAAAGIKANCSAIAIDSASFGVVIQGYSTSVGITLVSGTATVARSYQGYQARNYPGAKSGTNIYRANGSGTTSAYVNVERYTIYASTNGADTTNQTLADATVKKSRFNATDNPELYAMFNGSYDAYVAAKYEQYKAEYPINRGDLFNLASGYEETKLLGNVHHTRFDGTEIYDFPIHHAALTTAGVTCEGYITGFEIGDEYVAGLAEMKMIMEGVKTDKTDILNQTLGAIGVTKVDNGTTYRLAFQSYATHAWYFGGAGGHLNAGTARYPSYASRVLRAL